VVWTISYGNAGGRDVDVFMIAGARGLGAEVCHKRTVCTSDQFIKETGEMDVDRSPTVGTGRTTCGTTYVDRFP